MINYWLAKQVPTGPSGYNFSTLKKKKNSKTGNFYEFLDYLLCQFQNKFGLL